MATWKKIVVSGSSISALNNDANFLKEGQSGAELTGSFTGSFAGDGSGLTGVVASNSNALTQGNAITAFSYNGSTSGVTVGVNASGLVGVGLGHTGGNTLKVVAEDTTIAVGANGIKVVEANLSGIPNSALTNDSVTLGTTEVDLGTTATTIAGLTLTGVVATGTFSGSFSGTSNLPDLTSGNGLTGGPYDGAAAATFAVQADGSTLSVGASGVKVADAGITATQIASAVAGAGLSGGAGSALAVNVDGTSLEITTDTINVKAGGVSNAMLANDGITIAGTDVSLGGSITAATILSGSGVVSGSDAVPNPLTDGNGIADFSYNGGTAGIQVSVEAADNTISVASGGISVVEANLSEIPNSSLTNNSIQIGTTDIALGATGSSVADLTLTISPVPSAPKPVPANEPESTEKV